MPRPKRGEPGAKEASRKWKKTMLKKYGDKQNLHKRMQALGSVGGRRSRNGGFAANRALARIAGAKGGKKSKRGAEVRAYITEQRDYIVTKYHAGMSVPMIAKDLGVGYSSLLNWFHDNVKGYGEEDNG